ncbi:hypothetical protein [Spirosoma harenae]
MRTLFTLLLVASGFMACHSSDSVTPQTLTGAWVEISARRDTIIFNPTYNGSLLENTILVNRGKELNAGGYLVPKIGSGLYQYELQDSMIVVQNLLSSSMLKTGYRIERNGNQLRLENFFELGFNKPATATRTLVRL